MKNNKLTNSLIAIFTALSLTACSVSPKVQTVRIEDESMTKQELLAELKKLDDAQHQVDANRGVNATNVAAAVFWLPGLAYTFYDASEASNLINERRTHLVNLYNKKANESVKVAVKTTKKPVKGQHVVKESAELG